jgi:hypothetical protein
MTEARILTPATRFRLEADQLRIRAAGLSAEAYELLTTSRRDDRRPIFERVIRSTERLGQVAAELEAIAKTIDPEPVSIDVARGEVDQVYTFGERSSAADDPIP